MDKVVNSNIFVTKKNSEIKPSMNTMSDINEKEKDDMSAINENNESVCSDELEELNIKNNKKQAYSLDFKIAVVNYINQYKNSGRKILAEKRKGIIKKFNLEKSVLSRWEKRLKIIKEEKRIQAKRITGGGRQSLLKNYKKEIILWILHTCKAGYRVTIKTIMAFIYNLDNLSKEIKALSTASLRRVIKRFLDKNHLSIKKASRIGRPLPDKATELIEHFLYTIISKRLYLRINDYELNRIINLDETPVYYESPNTRMIETKGINEVIIDTEGNENKRINMLLSVCGDGSKLAPFCVFQGEKGITTEYILKDHELIRKKKIYAICQDKMWCETDIFLQWYEKIFLPYEKYVIKKRCLLILDKSPSHFNRDVIDKFNENKTNYVFIPGGLTRYLQPLDIGVNRLFQESLVREYTLHKTKNKNINLNYKKTPQEIRVEVIKHINHIWWETGDISFSEIKNGFYKGGISLKDDGSEDEDWEFPDKIIDHYSIYDEFENIKLENE